MGINVSNTAGAYIHPTPHRHDPASSSTASSGVASAGSSTSSTAKTANSTSSTSSSTSSSDSTAAASSAASTTSSTATTTDATTATADVSKDEFLKLLVAQLQYQDPMSPQDPTAFVTQLAQFSALEQSTQTNTQLASLTTTTQAGQRLEMANLVGQNATAKADTVAIAGAPQTPPSLSVHLPSNASDVKVQITDSAGNTVRTIDLGAQSTGDINTNWGGLNDKGQALPAGTYNVKVTATGSGGTTLDAYAEISGTVTAINFGSSGTQLAIAGSSVDPANIISVQK